MNVRPCESECHIPGAVLLQEGVLAVERSTVELQRGEASIVQCHRFLHRGHVLPWRRSEGSGVRGIGSRRDWESEGSGQESEGSGVGAIGSRRDRESIGQKLEQISDQSGLFLGDTLLATPRCTVTFVFALSFSAASKPNAMHFFEGTDWV